METFMMRENTWGRIILARAREVCKEMILVWSFMFEMFFLHDQ